MTDTTNEKGAAAVEMAFLTIFLVVLVTGIIDIGRAIYTDISVQEAAQEGAHYASFEEAATVAEIVDRTVNSTGSITIDPADVATTCTAVTRGKRNATRVTVTVDYTLGLITPVISDWFGGSLTLHKTAEVERFYESCPA